jgi:hypothetical protein
MSRRNNTSTTFRKPSYRKCCPEDMVDDALRSLKSLHTIFLTLRSHRLLTRKDRSLEAKREFEVILNRSLPATDAERYMAATIQALADHRRGDWISYQFKVQCAGASLFVDGKMIVTSLAAENDISIYIGDDGKYHVEFLDDVVSTKGALKAADSPRVNGNHDNDEHADDGEDGFRRVESKRGRDRRNRGDRRDRRDRHRDERGSGHHDGGHEDGRTRGRPAMTEIQRDQLMSTIDAITETGGAEVEAAEPVNDEKGEKQAECSSQLSYRDIVATPAKKVAAPKNEPPTPANEAKTTSAAAQPLKVFSSRKIKSWADAEDEDDDFAEVQDIVDAKQ